ncbi:MAG: hypothetical protein HYZ01_13550 [Ignavibacteriales bacterium]|nr:hypothetical protein [Ignavibacteriales bacterium]
MEEVKRLQRIVKELEQQRSEEEARKNQFIYDKLTNAHEGGGLSLKGIKSEPALPLKLGDTKAIEEARSSLWNTQQGRSSAVFDTPGEKAPGSFVELSSMEKRPDWMQDARIKMDKQITDMQREQDSLKARYQAMEAQLRQLREEIETSNSNMRGELMVRASRVKQDLSQTEYDILFKEKEIRKRGKLVIDTTIEKE